MKRKIKLNQKNKKNKAGFTLIELLVVIAIGALISSIALVAVNNARGRARNVRVAGDMHQLNTAMSFYYEKNNSQYPTGGVGFQSSDIPPFLDELVTDGEVARPLKSPSSFPYYYYYMDNLASSLPVLYNAMKNSCGGTDVPKAIAVYIFEGTSVNSPQFSAGSSHIDPSFPVCSVLVSPGVTVPLNCYCFFK